MASALRLSKPVFLSALDSNAQHLVTRLERELAELLGAQNVSRSDVDGLRGGPSWAAPGTAQVLVSTTQHDSWETRAHIMSRVDDSVAIPIVIEHPVVRIGPVADGVGPCFDCLSKRMIQHSLTDRFDRLRREAFRGTLGGPHFLLPHEVDLLMAHAIGLLEDMVAEIPRLHCESGRVVWLDLTTTSAMTGKVTGLHGCSTCGGQAGAPDERTWKFLAERRG